jgi:quercetin dioxygenase-like cupin family protein
MTHIDGLGLAELTTLVQNTAADTATWSSVARFDAADRFYARLHSDSRVDVWLLTWLHDQSTDLHDHGSSAAAFTVLGGELCEVRAATDGRLSTYRRHPGETTWVAPGVVHDVRHSSGPAISIHAYSPPLVTMTYYEARRGRLEPTRTIEATSPEFEGIR